LFADGRGLGGRRFRLRPRPKRPRDGQRPVGTAVEHDLCVVDPRLADLDPRRSAREERAEEIVEANVRGDPVGADQRRSVRIEDRRVTDHDVRARSDGDRAHVFDDDLAFEQIAEDVVRDARGETTHRREIAVQAHPDERARDERRRDGDGSPSVSPSMAERTLQTRHQNASPMAIETAMGAPRKSLGSASPFSWDLYCAPGIR